MEYKITIHDESETIELAENFESEKFPNMVICLNGDLGSGKTKFTEGFLSFFGLNDEISSPTFTIVNEYCKEDINIYHFDVYRLEDLDEFYAIGGPEYFDKGICLIEWGELIEPILSKYIKISILKDNNDVNVRYITVDNIG